MKAHLAALAAVLSAAAAAAALTAPAPAGAEEPHRNFAGSVQLDYLAVPTDSTARRQALDGSTVELSLKLAMDFSEHASTSVKVCYACHGFEVGMAFFDLRVADELNFRVGRFTPAFGEFPLRHDPANHRTSDKPLPYDMGRMLRIREWNLGVLPAPWVDNGLEVDGSHFFGELSQIDWAVYAVMGPRAGTGALDFDFTQSRTPAQYYVDNNSRPTVGARLAGTLGLSDDVALSLGGSAMTGTYDPDHQLDFLLVGADMVVRVGGVFWRSEALVRRTQFDLGPDPANRFRYGPGVDGEFDDFFVKGGFYSEVEVPVGRLDLVGRFDGLWRRGNVPVTSSLRSESAVLRYTAATSYRLTGALRLKTSIERYDFSDFDDEIAVHVGLAGPF